MLLRAMACFGAKPGGVLRIDILAVRLLGSGSELAEGADLVDDDLACADFLTDALYDIRYNRGLTCAGMSGVFVRRRRSTMTSATSATAPSGRGLAFGVLLQ